jgi:hypothetical protein
VVVISKIMLHTGNHVAEITPERRRGLPPGCRKMRSIDGALGQSDGLP